MAREEIQGQWTPPREVSTGGRLQWSPATGDVIVRGQDLHLALSVSVRDSGGGMDYVRRVDGRWSRTRAYLPGHPSHVTMQPSGKNSVLILYTATDPQAGVSNGAHLYLIRMSQRDAIMPAAQRIQWSGLANATWPQLLRVPSAAGRTALVVIWAPVERRKGTAARVQIAQSVDEGRTWAEGAPLAVDPEISSIVAEVDAHGTVHVIAAVPHTMAARSVSAPSMLHLQWETQGWSQPVGLSFGAVAAPATLSVIGRDRLLLSWRAMRVSVRAGQPAPVGNYAVLRFDCRSSATTGE